MREPKRSILNEDNVTAISLFDELRVLDSNHTAFSNGVRLVMTSAVGGEGAGMAKGSQNPNTLGF